MQQQQRQAQLAAQTLLLSSWHASLLQHNHSVTTLHTRCS
jgi:hypothetical protein